MGNAIEKLNGTLTALLDAIQEHMTILAKTVDSGEKQKIADIVRSLSESQKNIVQSINVYNDEDLGFMNDDYFEDEFYDDNDSECNGLMDTKQISFSKSKKAKNNKNKKSIKKLEDEDLPF
jgi:hypothetical protein